MRFVASMLTLFAALTTAYPALAQTVSDLDRCLLEQDLPRAVRVLGPDGQVVFGRVVESEAGVPTAVLPLPGGDAPLAEVLDRVGIADPGGGSPLLRLAAGSRATRICSPFAVPQTAIEAEERVVVAVGLNYAAHAEEAGGGDVFLFPKPVAPTRPYGEVVRHAGVTLLDWEVELGFVLLADVDLRALPTREELLARSAFFVANEVSDREPIILEKALRGPGTGFVAGKGRTGFLPAGPWMVRGTELFAALDACGAGGLGLELAVDEGDGFEIRQKSTTAAMILDPHALLARIAAEVEHVGLETPMPVLRDGKPRHYPLAVGAEAPRLPAGSVILTGTPDGIALKAPSPLGVTLRGILRLRSPFAQALAEEQARAAAAVPGGYLEPGDRVRASIDGLGAQIVRVVDADARLPQDPCAGP